MPVEFVASYLVMLREGMEAALIVGIVAGYLKQTGRERWVPAVWIGVGAAALLCLVFGIALKATSAELPQKIQELFEAVIALIAVGILTSMIFWMLKAARSMKGELQASVDRALEAGNRQGLALVGMAFLAVGREGLESVFFLHSTFQQNVGWVAPVGALLGLLTAVGVGYGIYLGGVKLDLRKFFRWTGIFIVLVAAGLLAGAVKSLHEAGIWNHLQQRVFDLSEVLPTDNSNVLGTVLAAVFGYQESPTLGALIAYLAFAIPVATIFLMRTRATVPSRTVRA